MKKISLAITALSLLCATFISNNRIISVSADDSTSTEETITNSLATVTDVAVTGSDGNYQIAFTDSNDSSNVEAYQVIYKIANNGVYTTFGSEYISSSGATINSTNFLKRGVYFVSVVAISSSEDFSNSEESALSQFWYYPAMYQNGIVLENLIEFNNKPSEAYSGGVSGVKYDIEGYDFSVFKYNLLTDSSSGYVTSFNEWEYYIGHTTLKDHVYYFGFTYKFNEDYSTYFAENTFDAELNSITAYNQDYANYQATHLKFPNGDVKEGRVSTTLTALESTNLGGINFGLNASLAQNTGITSLEAFAIKDIVLLDLTAAYGSGNEPSAAAIDDFIASYGSIDYIELTNNSILGPQYLEASCTSPLSSSDILKKYKTLDGSAIYILESNYTENATRAGNYFVTLAYKDSIGTTSKRMVNVVVKDDVLPVIELVDGSDEIVSKISSPLTSAEIIAKVKATDNSDGNIKSAVTIDATNYLANQKVVGRYPVTLQVTDSAGNTATKTIYISVVNDLGPVFDAPTVIYKSTDIVFNVNDVLNTISSVVDQDGNYLTLWSDNGLNSDYFNIIQDTFTGNANKAGSYVVKVKAWDVEGRVSYHTFTIKVVEDIPNIVMYNNTINVSFDTNLSNKDIKNILKKCGYTNKTEENAIITFPINEYEDNNYAAGQSYDVKVRYVCANGTEENYNLVIKVLDTETMAIENTSWFSQNWGWIVAIIGAITVIGIVVNIKKK